jgi:nicotinamide-nucleotide amidase
VTYSNAAKHELLGVSEATLEQYGAVSEQVVREMAQGVLHAAGADIGLSVSGIAGPDGGSTEKPVGTVWFGFAGRDGRIVTAKQHFSGDREAVRLQAAVFAIQTALFEFLQN